MYIVDLLLKSAIAVRNLFLCCFLLLKDWWGLDREERANLLLERTRRRPACWASRKDSSGLIWVEKLQVWTVVSCLGCHLRLGLQLALSRMPSRLSACNGPGFCLRPPTVRVILYNPLALPTRHAGLLASCKFCSERCIPLKLVRCL